MNYRYAFLCHFLGTCFFDRTDQTDMSEVRSRLKPKVKRAPYLVYKDDTGCPALCPYIWDLHVSLLVLIPLLTFQSDPYGQKECVPQKYLKYHNR